LPEDAAVPVSPLSTSSVEDPLLQQATYNSIGHAFIKVVGVGGGGGNAVGRMMATGLQVGGVSWGGACLWRVGASSSPHAEILGDNQTPDLTASRVLL
jgi:hypothetical protein